MKKKRGEPKKSAAVIVKDRLGSKLDFRINPELITNPEKVIREMEEIVQKTYDELQKKFRSRPPFRRPWWPIRSAT